MTKDIQQSNFKFDLGDYIVIMFPNAKNESLKGIRGRISHRGYQDCINMSGYGESHPDVYTNLYCIEDENGDRVPGMPEGWLAKDFTQDLLEET